MNLREPSRGSIFLSSAHSAHLADGVKSLRRSRWRGRAQSYSRSRHAEMSLLRGSAVPSPPPPLPERATRSARVRQHSMIIIIFTSNLCLSLFFPSSA